MQIKSSPMLCFAVIGWDGIYCCRRLAHSLYICIITAYFKKEGKEIFTSLNNPASPSLATPSIPSFLEMRKQHQHQHLLLLLSLMFLVAVAAATAAADPQSQQVQQSQMRARMRMSRRARSLLQPPKPDCPSTCTVRCSNNWNNEMCNKMCNVCCNKCSCVPPGTGQDTRHLCPCYDTMVNPHTGKLKCP